MLLSLKLRDMENGKTSRRIISLLRETKSQEVTIVLHKCRNGKNITLFVYSLFVQICLVLPEPFRLQ